MEVPTWPLGQIRITRCSQTKTIHKYASSLQQAINKPGLCWSGRCRNAEIILRHAKFTAAVRHQRHKRNNRKLLRVPEISQPRRLPVASLRELLFWDGFNFYTIQRHNGEAPGRFPLIRRIIFGLLIPLMDLNSSAALQRTL